MNAPSPPRDSFLRLPGSLSRKSHPHQSGSFGFQRNHCPRGAQGCTQKTKNACARFEKKHEKHVTWRSSPSLPSHPNSACVCVCVCVCVCLDSSKLSCPTLSCIYKQPKVATGLVKQVLFLLDLLGTSAIFTVFPAKMSDARPREMLTNHVSL